MAQSNAEDRRHYPRADLEFDVNVDIAEMPVLPVKALNLSASGIYCVSTNSLGELTRVDLALTIEKEDVEIRARAVVIREEELPNGSYGIGMFFTSIADEDRATIAELVADINLEPD